MSGFCGSNDYMESPPVADMFGFKDSGDYMKIPPGYRFHPTDEELITHYLSRKIADSSFCATDIVEADLKRLEPWDFPGGFFFSPRDRKYATGPRTNRATYSGYWKATRKDTEIFKGKTLVGMKKTLIFYKGRAPKVAKTDWIMHEYRLEDLSENAKNEWVICKVFLKSSVEKKTDSSGIRAEELRASMMSYPLLMSLLQTIQTLAKASNVEHDTLVDSINVGVRQQIELPKQQSNLDAENAAAASSSMSSHNNTTMKDNSRVWVKVGYNNDTVMFVLPSATMDSLKTEIVKRYNKLEAETLKIRYKDEDEEMVTIACDEDLHYCFEFFKSTATPIRLSLLN